ncbi:RimJ/RimL family protein N-acetyltransferase [Clostridium tetanomorphum]|uniref:GNAT family N-acetyltransferase n=1 Tax=Clostridium tetanomorphum TaxID=1553 RepID=A0A923J1W0_CLOTT|nr:GNAT family protein [Clostridium tetanomorphum]KAJ53587.1 GCN5-like N-acetyltransferase [Clostridium tetanomorphum DSM 665]MBC2397793.1 GNAT family N-acetyltransferase [Clostridium tetanomorphum]MBP1864604.1 RimJ/RimL family protein N-acetyltransferase [Clostridium tetanomorphum]NRS84073.1 RimJ/RimL family protein N-acetyltransferase [Clostridium tetanomorphum]NRZ97287.1 RimJ/RimL family protein N-acetyltransferase [Clostridium tetanomorphum]
MYYGEKIKLRAYKREDIPLAYEYMNDSELKRLLGNKIPYPMILEEEERWFENLINSENSYDFAIEDLKSGKYIGGCGINQINWLNRIATIGIFIGDKNYWGKGYGTDVINTLVKFIFEQMNMNKVKLKVFSFNERAKKCYEKCGFRLEGVLRQELFRDGKYNDEYIMSILFEEWNKIS